MNLLTHLLLLNVPIYTPITTNPAFAFLVSFKWDAHMRRYSRRCRVQLAREIRPAIAERYALEQMANDARKPQ